MSKAERKKLKESKMESNVSERSNFTILADLSRIVN